MEKSKLRVTAKPFVFTPNPNAPVWQPSTPILPVNSCAPTSPIAAVPILKPTAKEFVPKCKKNFFFFDSHIIIIHVFYIFIFLFSCVYSAN